MKILFLMPSRARGGCEEFALTAARAALQRKQEVVLAFPNLPETQSLIDDCKKAGIDYVPLRQRNTSSPLRLLTLFLLALNFASALRLFL
ncbi:MAG TPA: hypothetical protein PLP17_17205, partial [Oligoflexia bacterium]|nr:hypothetical protein [Oligoflexia bacterium]